MYDLKAIRLAHEQGTAVGQIAIAEFIIKSYGHTLDPRLTRFLQKVKQDSYEVIGKVVDVPAEDLALRVGLIVENTVDITK